MAGRVAGSQLHAIGLPELVTHDLAAYTACIASLARERDALTHLKHRLATNRASSALFDMARFTRGLEDTLLEIASS